LKAHHDKIVMGFFFYRKLRNYQASVSETQAGNSSPIVLLTLGEDMGLLTFLLLGLIAGVLARTLLPDGGGGLLSDIVLGIVGAFLGGWIFSQFGSAGVTGLNLYSILVALVGSIIVLAISRLFMRRRPVV
jgi:uncharacterized membrane protein YeaQ/YmgE (transglycosylase-associated protein family)